MTSHSGVCHGNEKRLSLPVDTKQQWLFLLTGIRPFFANVGRLSRVPVVGRYDHVSRPDPALAGEAVGSDILDEKAGGVRLQDYRPRPKRLARPWHPAVQAPRRWGRDLLKTHADETALDADQSVELAGLIALTAP